MSAPVTCPVCNYNQVSAQAETCPQCDADLSGLRVLELIPESSQTQIQGSGWRQVSFLLTVAIVGLISLASIQTVRLSRERLDNDNRYQLLMHELKSLEATVISLEQQVNARDKSSQAIEEQFSADEFIFYTTEDDDTLWKISERFYGSGYYYPLLLELNPGTTVYNISGQMSLRLVKKRARARDLFSLSYTIENDQPIYQYRVQEGETLTSIAARLYSDPEQKEQFYQLNPGTTPEAGALVKIPLPRHWTKGLRP